MSIKTLNVGIGKAMGLNQSIDENLMSLKYSPDCQNIDVSQGIISTAKGTSAVIIYDSPGQATEIAGADRFFEFGKEFREPQDDDPELNETRYPWGELHGPIFFVKDGHFYRWGITGYAALGATWDWIQVDETATPADATYRAINYKISGENVLILVNGTQTLKLYWKDETETDDHYVIENLGGTPPTGKFICLHRERIWIAGNAENPNTVYYCNAYDPEDWSAAGETGNITVETFKGDEITEIANLLDDVLIFKRNSIWKVNGDLPSEYAVVQVYSGAGTIAPDSICTDGVNCFFASEDGIYSYNGVQVEPYLTDKIKTFFAARYNTNTKMLVHNNKLYMFGMAYASVLIHDILHGTTSVMSMWPNYTIQDVNVVGNDVVILTSTGYVCKLSDTALKIFISSTTGAAISAYWYTPETDFGYPNAEKTLDEIAFVGWGTDSAGAAGGQVKFTIYYNRGSGQQTYEKIVTLAATRTPYAIPLTLTGRIMKIKVENVNGSAINISDLRFIFELDED